MMEKQRLVSPAMKDRVLKHLCEQCAIGGTFGVKRTDEELSDLGVRRNEFSAILGSFGNDGLVSADTVPTVSGATVVTVKLQESAHKFLNEGGYSGQHRHFLLQKELVEKHVKVLSKQCEEM